MSTPVLNDQDYDHVSQILNLPYPVADDSPPRYADLIGENMLDNGDFTVHQRGSSFTSTGGGNNDGAYLYDRWCLLSDGNDIVDVSTTTTPPPLGKSRNRLVFDIETANKKFGIAQIVEAANVQKLQGGSVVFSFEAIRGLGSIQHVKAAIIAWSGTADAPTKDFISAWGANNTLPTLAANWTYLNTPTDLSVSSTLARYSVTAVVANTSYKNLAVFLWSDSTSSTVGNTLVVSELQLEKGTFPTSFQPLPHASQLHRCQRFYEVLHYNSSGQGFVPALYSGSTYVGYWFFKADKFKTPTVSLSTGSWTGGTPTIIPEIGHCYFTRSGGFIASGTTGAVALVASADF